LTAVHFEHACRRSKPHHQGVDILADIFLRAAAIYTLIATAKLNDIDPQAWLADVLARLPDHPAKRIHELLPWNWRPQNVAHAA
jgi:hypothetical protein